MESMEPVFESVARYFSLLSEPSRLRILYSICQEEKSVNQIVEETGMTQTSASRHLNLMYQAGVLGRRKEANLVFYRVADQELVAVCRSVCVRVASELDGNKALKKNFKELINELG
jgi:DNA-binding transcriptional ArsR family regulator